MVKQNASIDASFWINSCRADVALHVTTYFHLFTPSSVAAEIRYPLTVLGMAVYSTSLFDRWVQAGTVVIQDPQATVDWFQTGENDAIALATERNYFLLMDDANPYHRARAAGLPVVGTPEFIVLLFDQGQIPYTSAVDAMTQIRANKQLKRTASTTLEMLARQKGVER